MACGDSGHYSIYHGAAIANNLFGHAASDRDAPIHSDSQTDRYRDAPRDSDRDADRDSDRDAPHDAFPTISVGFYTYANYNIHMYVHVELSFVWYVQVLVL